MTTSNQASNYSAIIVTPRDKADQAVASRSRGIPGARSVYHMGVSVPDLDQTSPSSWT